MAIDWRSTLRPASFRGVPFFVEALDDEGGRRIVEHQYPGRDLPWSEDLGRAARRITIDAFLLEPDVAGQSVLLQEACEARGAGTLVHPFLGSTQQICLSFRRRFASDRGRAAHFILTLVEPGLPRYPATQDDAASAVAKAGNTLKDRATRLLKRALSGGLTAVVSDAVSAVIGEVSGAIEEALGPYLPDGVTAADFSRGIGLMAREAAAFARDPDGFSTLLGSIYAQGKATVPGYSAWSGLTEFSSALAQTSDSDADDTTSSRAQSAAAASAVQSYVRQTAVAEQAETAVAQASTGSATSSTARVPFETADEVTAARDAIAATIDRELAATGDPQVWRALQDLRTEMVRQLTRLAPTLPRRIAYPFSGTAPALVIAQRIYGDRPADVPGMAAEIVQRNRVRHPLFAGGGDSIQVLGDA